MKRIYHQNPHTHITFQALQNKWQCALKGSHPGSFFSLHLSRTSHRILYQYHLENIVCSQPADNLKRKSNAHKNHKWLYFFVAALLNLGYCDTFFFYISSGSWALTFPIKVWLGTVVCSLLNLLEEIVKTASKTTSYSQSSLSSIFETHLCQERERENTSFLRK